MPTRFTPCGVVSYCAHCLEDFFDTPNELSILETGYCLEHVEEGQAMADLLQNVEEPSEEELSILALAICQ